jgi:hypothetical protein
MFRVIQDMTMKWVAFVAVLGQMRNVKILLRKPEGVNERLALM